MGLQNISPIQAQTAQTTDKGKLDPKLLQKVQDFQSVLLNQFIAAMEPKEGFFGKGFGGGFFQSLFRDEMAKQLSKELDLGLGQQLLKAQLQEKEDVTKKI